MQRITVKTGVSLERRMSFRSDKATNSFNDGLNRRLLKGPRNVHSSNDLTNLVKSQRSFHLNPTPKTNEHDSSHNQ